jgi:hypothetical protein
MKLNNTSQASMPDLTDSDIQLETFHLPTLVNHRGRIRKRATYDLFVNLSWTTRTASSFCP